MRELIPILVIIFVIGIPMASLATHFVLRPLVKDIVEALKGGSPAEIAALQQRIGELEADLARHEVQLGDLADTAAFHRQLESDVH